MIIVDVRGKLCPMPLIETKKAIRESGGEEIKIIIDNEISVKNVMRYLSDNGVHAEQRQAGGVHEIFINAGQIIDPSENAADYCEAPTGNTQRFIVIVGRDHMGDGPAELGQVLAGSLMNTINSMDQLPWRIVFYNSGVLLALKDSFVLPMLKSLEEKGVEMISCTTCLNYFEKLDELAVGRTSGMPEIVDSILTANRTIYF